jgi:hypothetical protein
MELLTGMRKKTIALLLVLLAGCNTIVEKGGRIVDGSAFAEKTLARYQTPETEKKKPKAELTETISREGESHIVLSLEEFPAVKIRGSAPRETGDFFFTSVEYLGGSYTGWNEFTLDLSGVGRFVKDENGGTLSIAGPLEPVQISAGKILRNGTRFTGDEALTSLRNRRERILALSEWMRDEGPSPAGRKEFEAYWKPILLPELVSRKKRPAAFNTENVRWVRAEDVRWNASYTETLFPEDLRILRDSGALLRDWEEALEWIYFEYRWDEIVRYLSAGINMKRVK